MGFAVSGCGNFLSIFTQCFSIFITGRAWIYVLVTDSVSCLHCQLNFILANCELNDRSCTLLDKPIISDTIRRMRT
jgi:hypothetical protein